MGTEWKRLNLQSGAWVATVTAIAIGAGAMLWYERPEPRYPTTRDEATMRFALLERTVVDADGLNTETNVVGFCPSRGFYAGTGAGTLAGYLGLLGGYLVDSPWCDLWSGSVPGVAHINGRNIDVFPCAVDPVETMDLEWWRTNVYADAPDFGRFDFHYSNSATFYMNTNILHQAARAISAFRWRFAEGPYMASTNPVGYYDSFTVSGSSEPTNNYYDAVDQAVAALAANDFTAGEYGMLLDNIVLRHWIQIKRNNDPVDPPYPAPPWPDDHFRITLTEECVLRPRRCFVPPATNCAAWEIGAFAAGAEKFWHPYAVTGQWEVTSIAMEDIGGGTYGFAEQLFKWQGRIDAGEIGYPGGYIPWAGRSVVGWKSMVGDWDTEIHDQIYSSRPVFVTDWRFTCLTDHAYFWGAE